MTTSMQPEAGAVYERPYPFVRDVREVFYVDSEGGNATDEVPTWKPGVRFEYVQPDGTESFADALGRVVLTVVSVHKPGRFPTRVFFTRTWIDPEGKAFGKTKCRMTTVPAFKRLAHGYMHQFRLKGCACDGCTLQYDHRMQGWTKDAEKVLA